MTKHFTSFHNANPHGAAWAQHKRMTFSEEGRLNPETQYHGIPSRPRSFAPRITLCVHGLRRATGVTAAVMAPDLRNQSGLTEQSPGLFHYLSPSFTPVQWMAGKDMVGDLFMFEYAAEPFTAILV